MYQSQAILIVLRTHTQNLAISTNHKAVRCSLQLIECSFWCRPFGNGNFILGGNEGFAIVDIDDAGLRADCYPSVAS